MNTKPTPGPWSAHGTVLRDAAGNSIASGGNNRVVTGETLAASLKLAAAAPKLLAMLQKAVRLYGVDMHPEHRDEFRTAIAEATRE